LKKRRKPDLFRCGSHPALSRSGQGCAALPGAVTFPTEQPVRSRYAPYARWELALLAAILLLAGALRMGAPGITEFKRDEANLSRLALDLAQGSDFPLLGISSSVGIPNPPISAYLFALPYALDSTPLLATVFVGALNVLAVALTWLLMRRAFDARPALIAALLYAASPWAVLFSRKIWAQDLLPPFVVGAVLLGIMGFRER